MVICSDCDAGRPGDLVFIADTICTGALPEGMVRLLKEGVGQKTEHNHISSFQAFCVSTASRVGVGNIAGIAIAIVSGGPGAIFWMWIIAVLGSATGFIESTLAQIYKVPREGGGYRGGPAYYIKNVLGNKPMAALFAVLISVTFGLILIRYRRIQSQFPCRLPLDWIVSLWAV